MRPIQKQTQKQSHFAKQSAKKTDASAKKSSVNSDNTFSEKSKTKPAVKAANQPKIEGEKLQKVLARAGQGSRREIEAMIAANRVSVDGKMATLGDRINVHSGVKVRIDGQIINLNYAKKKFVEC